MKHPSRWAAVGLLLLLAACDGEPTGPAVTPITELPRDLSVAEQAVIEGSNAFAFGLLREVRALESDSPNTFLSPLSASMALGMTMNGAAGDTWTQMRDALGFEGMTEEAINEGYHDLIGLLLTLDPTVEVGLGNAVWSDASRVALLPSFVDRVETWFDAEADTLDFGDPAAPDVMNAWVEEVTHGRIQDFIEQIDPAAVAYLVNAIYFQGEWRDRFDPDDTRAGTFTRTDGSQVDAEFMHAEVGYRLLHDDGTRGVELPYGGGAFTAVAVLPPAGQGIDELVAGLSVATWDEWMENFDAAAEVEDREEPGLEIVLPKFELAWKDSLIAPLQALGMHDVFDGSRADLSRMNGARDLYVGEVFQQTFVKVDEKGTEAAAATAVSIYESSAPAALAFDRPFLFAIRERYSGALLFMGVIGDPS